MRFKASIIAIFITVLSSLGMILPAKAVCPVCTIAVGAGVGFAQWLGIDDTITGLWVGGLTVSLILWTINWLKKKNVNFRWRGITTALFYYILIVVPLHYTGIVGHPFNKLWGIDRLLLGIAIGSIFFFVGAVWYNYLKQKNGKALFPFQKVAMPLAPLVILSGIFYLITR